MRLIDKDKSNSPLLALVSGSVLSVRVRIVGCLCANDPRTPSTPHNEVGNGYLVEQVEENET